MLLHNSRKFFKVMKPAKMSFVTLADKTINKGEENGAAESQSGQQTDKVLHHSLKRHFSRPSIVVQEQMSADPFDLEGDALREVFPTVVNDLANRAQELNLGQETVDRYLQMLTYTVPNTAMIRTEWAMMAFKAFERSENLTPENLKVARTVGWCILMEECFLEVFDDIMDGTQTRRGQRTWHNVDGIGLQAINDCMVIDASIYYLLKKYLGGRRCYMPIMEQFLDATLCCGIGLSAEECCNKPDGKQTAIERMTMEQYKAIVLHTSGKFFSLPIAVAMHLADVHDPIKHEQAMKISTEIGAFFLVQDDYLDLNQDIAEGKIRWPTVAAYENATPEQRKILRECYGKTDEKSVRTIKEVYEAIDVVSLYRKFEEEQTKKLGALATTICKDIPHEIFTKLITKLYRREKDL